MRAHRPLSITGLLVALLPVLSPSSGAQLDLPKGTSETVPTPTEGSPRLPRAAKSSPGVALEGATRTGAERAYESLARRRRLEATLLAEALAVLVAAGPPALDVSRAHLAEARNASILVLAGRHLLREGEAADRARVSRRLEEDLPAEAAAVLLEELAQRDPVLASPTFLAGLLEHPQGSLRSAAQRLLRDRADESLVPALAEHFGSERSATRRLVVELAERIDAPSARNLLVEALGDGHASVARLAAEALAESPSPEVDALLVEVVFAQAARDRRGAYAQLALADREDREQRAILDESGLEVLRSALASPDPLVSGAAAISLAGIGFRSPASREMAWLDREVPHFLVRHGTGVVYHNDLSSLAEPALRRMALLSGQRFGSDGAAWQRYWIENAERFVARRAALDVRPEEIGRLILEWRRPGEETWILLGLEAQAPSTGEGQRLYLGEPAMRRLVAALRGERVFETVRLPVRPQANNLAGSRQLILRLAGIEKHLAQPRMDAAPWFDRVEQALAESVETHRWQLLFDRVRYESQRAFFDAEREWWETTAPGPERTQRVKDLSLASLLEVEGPRRERLGESLEELYAAADVPRAADFPALLALLEDEPYYGPGAERWVRLALASAAASEVRAPGGTVDPERGEALFLSLVKRFGPSAGDDLGRVLAALGTQRRRAAAQDHDPAVRVVAARLFAGSPVEADQAIAVTLLEDRDPTVELAAVEALGLGGVGAARVELLVRSREGESLLRAAALRALGRIGGEGVLDTCVEALGERDPVVQAAAVEALADLRDPGSASLLGALFARGPDSGFFAAARRGLLGLDEEGEFELLRLARLPQRRAQRDAVFALAERGTPQAAALLMTLLSEEAGDPRVSHELAVLTCLDLRQDPAPAEAWWRWWDGVVHDDSLAWLRAGAERAGIQAPPAGALEGRGNRVGALFLVDLIERGGYPLEDRARRELTRLLGSGLPLPLPGEVRSAWFERLRTRVRASF